MRKIFNMFIWFVRTPKAFEIIKLLWVSKMNTTAGDMSKGQLLISLALFTVFGTVLSLYIATRGFLSHNSASFHIDAVTNLETVKREHNSKSFPLPVIGKKHKKIKD